MMRQTKGHTSTNTAISGTWTRRNMKVTVPTIIQLWTVQIPPKIVDEIRWCGRVTSSCFFKNPTYCLSFLCYVLYGFWCDIFHQFILQTSSFRIHRSIMNPTNLEKEHEKWYRTSIGIANNSNVVSISYTLGCYCYCNWMRLAINWR